MTDDDGRISLDLDQQQAGSVLGALAWVMGALQIMRDRGHAEQDEEFHDLHDRLVPRLEQLVDRIALARQAADAPRDQTELESAYTEVREETGLDRQDVELLKRGEPLLVVDESQREWLVHTFLFSAREPSLIKLDWEHTQARWIEPEAIPKFQTVPQLKEAWEQLWKR